MTEANKPESQTAASRAKPGEVVVEGKQTKKDPERAYKTVVIHRKNSEDGEFADLGVNGVAWRIRRDVEVDIPLEVLEVLQNAREELLVQVPGERPSEEVYEERVVPRFAYSVKEAA